MFICESLADFEVGHALLDLMDRAIEFYSDDDDLEHEADYYRYVGKRDEIVDAMLAWEESVFDAR